MLLWLLAIAMPVICAAPEGILHPGTGTTVDGTVALDGMHIFGGQLLRTQHGQESELLTRGSSIKMLSDTKLLFNGDSAQLIEGEVALSTENGFFLRSDCAEIMPGSQAAARYTVQIKDKTIYVSADQSELTVRSRKSVRLENGKTAAVFCGTPKEEIVVSGGSHGSSKVWIAGAAGGVAGAAAGALIRSKPDMSPDHP